MSGMDSVAAQVAACPLSGDGEAPVVVACVGLHRHFGPVRAVDGLDLVLRSGEIAALLGPSGCGKTTLLRLLAGFERPDAGTSRSAAPSSPAGAASPRPSGAGSAWSSRTTRSSPTSTSRRTSATPSAAAPTAARVAEVLDLVGLAGLGDRRPDELSGGQQQRVALARALAPTPQMILLDEPFSNLDAALRDRVRTEVRDILRAAGVTTLLVTHDQEEALSLADTVSVMRDGRVEQTGRPEEVYGSPATRWVGEFLGEIDVLPGEAADGAATCALGRVPVPRELTGPVEVLVRPESLSLGTHRDHGEHEAVVVDRTFYGHDQLVTVELATACACAAAASASPPGIPATACASV